MNLDRFQYKEDKIEPEPETVTCSQCGESTLKSEAIWYRQKPYCHAVCLMHAIADWGGEAEDLAAEFVACLYANKQLHPQRRYWGIQGGAGELFEMAVERELKNPNVWPIE